MIEIGWLYLSQSIEIKTYRGEVEMRAMEGRVSFG
jgi:hypothetical protein